MGWYVWLLVFEYDLHSFGDGGDINEDPNPDENGPMTNGRNRRVLLVKCLPAAILCI